MQELLFFSNQSLLLIFIFDEIKLIAKDEFLIFLMAMEASLGIFGEASIIFKERSFIDETSATNSSSLESGFNSKSSLKKKSVICI